MFTLADLIFAYRKAKVDLYYSSHISLSEIVEYEENLHENLSSLLEKINGNDEAWIKDSDFLGTWTVVPKSIEIDLGEGYGKCKSNDLVFASPADRWKHLMQDVTHDNKPKAEFRLMAKCSIAFHVLSTLWILKVGHLFDEKLSKCAYGNRLRRKKNNNDTDNLSFGSFQSYLKPFSEWRDKGILAMRNALQDNEKIVALTADISSFYHELNPDFMQDQHFLADVLQLTLDGNQKKLHSLFINALLAWAQETPLKKGLPVGLPASAIIANVALIELDHCIERHVVPIYYGRYVDDILLVVKNTHNFNSSQHLWEWLFAHTEHKLGWTTNERKSVSFRTAYLSEGERISNIQFSNSKNKIFILAGKQGITLVDAIAHQIRERASEWRLMPNLRREGKYTCIDLLRTIENTCEKVTHLRKTDALTMSRANFSRLLRDFEAYERDLHPEAWGVQRRDFLSAFIQHVLVLPHFFDLAIYLPRVIRLATACEDFEYLRKIIDALVNLCSQVEDQCDIRLKACSNQQSPLLIDQYWKVPIFREIHENIAAAFLPKLSNDGKRLWEKYMGSVGNISYFTQNWDLQFLDWTVKNFQRQQARFFSCDIAHIPFRFIGLPKEMVLQRGIPARRAIVNNESIKELWHEVSTKLSGLNILAKWIKFPWLPQGLLFATRPFSLPELFIINRAAYTSAGQPEMKQVVKAVRGFVLDRKTPQFDKNQVLQISNGVALEKCGIVVSSWQTRIESWVASVMKMQDPDIDRYERLCRLLDGVIANPKGSRYLVLPELALPAHWFMRIATKLQEVGISLITGIEYLHASKKQVRNQVWAALSHNGFGFLSFMIYRQDKQRSALHEERELQRLAGLKINPEIVWTTPPIIQHGDFRFAILVCSELTNIRYRADVRGKVDALFVPEWNQDTETFNALVESAALDVHAYIIQCNDRQYGDSRIRAPYKNNWKRDVLRVKGGIADYCVIGEIDVRSLRQFQSSFRSPGKPFKPVPDGFNTVMNYHRRILPLAED